MIKNVLAAAVTAALFGIASVSWAQGAGGAGGAAGGGAGTSGAGASGGAGGGSPGSSSNVPGGGSATQDATTGSTAIPSQCFGMLGAERERCVSANRGSAGVGSSQTPTHPGDAAKGDNRYNSPATGTGPHSVPKSGSGAGTRQ